MEKLRQAARSQRLKTNVNFHHVNNHTGSVNMKFCFVINLFSPSCKNEGGAEGRLKRGGR